MKYKNIFGMAISALALGATVAACTDANDWETDPTYNRLFGVNASKITIDRDQEAPSTVTVNFNPIQGAEYYIVEVSTDSLYNDVEMGGENAIVFGTNKDITKSPVTLTGLAEETNYYMRIKTMSSTTPESHWAYYNSGESFKTLGIIYDVPAADILEDRITLRWIPGSEVSHITYTTKIDEQDVTETRQLTKDEIANSTCTIDGLQSNKTYNFAIYKGEQLRGTKTVKTAKPMPAADLKQELPENTTAIDQDLLDNLAAQALAITGTDKASITIGVPAGKTLVLGDKNESGENSSVSVPEGISITFFGMAGEVPTLQLYKALNADGEHGYIRFENVNIDAMYEEGKQDGCQYVIQDKSSCKLDSLVFTDCNISNIQRALVSFESSNGEEAIHKLRINNCVVTNHVGDYAFINIAKGGCTVDNIEVTNSTFNGLCQTKNKSFIDVGLLMSDAEIVIEHCTFYDALYEKGYFISAKETKGNVTASLYGVLLGKVAKDEVRAYQGDNLTISATNSYMTSDFKLDKEYDWGVQSYNGSSADIFTDPVNGDFTLKMTDLIRDKVGDPRWIPAN